MNKVKTKKRKLRIYILFYPIFATILLKVPFLLKDKGNILFKRLFFGLRRPRLRKKGFSFDLECLIGIKSLPKIKPISSK